MHARTQRRGLKWSGLAFAPNRGALGASAATPTIAPARAAAAEPRARPAWSAPYPDLLHVEPHMAIDAESLSSQLAFAFAGGEAAERIRAILADVEPTPTTWEPASFSTHLFLHGWVEQLAQLPFHGKALEADAAGLRRVLSHPPSDAEVRRFRHAVLGELDRSPTLEAELVELHRELRRLRTLMVKPAPDGAAEGTARRIQILSSIRLVIDRMALGFGGARSGLSRLGELGAARRADLAFARLVDLLDHDRLRATVSIELRLGGDGKVRDMIIARIHEDTKNRYHRTPGQRWWEKLTLFVRGYRFSEAELVDRWIDAVYAEHAALLPGFLQLIGHVEWYLAALALRDQARERGLAVCLPVFADEPGEHAFTALWNPLLAAQGVRPVPCDLVRGQPGVTTIVTGPNSGGKTRLLQSIGLAQLLAQAGGFVPAASARMRAVPYLFCSLVQEERYDQSEGRLGTELMRIRHMFERAPPGSLLIIDELCSGTNPSEGEEIFMLVLALFDELEPETFVTTHFLDFAQRLSSDASTALRLRFLRVQLDEAQEPTFGFVPGVAPTSLAARAAARLGVTRDELHALVRKHSG